MVVITLIGKFTWGLVSMLRFEESKTLVSDLNNDLAELIELAAFGAALQLDDNISAGNRSGTKYRKYPRRSSAEGEYPQEQFGKLRRMIQYERGEGTSSEVGFTPKNSKEERQLIYLERTGDPTKGGIGLRRPLYMSFEGKDADVMKKRMEEMMRSR